MTAFEELLGRYKDTLALKNYSPRTIHKYAESLKKFFTYLTQEKGIQRIQDVQKEAIQEYQTKVFNQKRLYDGKPLSLSSKASTLQAVKSFFGFCSRKREILYNPAYDIEIPLQREGSLKEVLKEGELKKLLEAASGQTPLDLRNKALLEILYSTGLRNTEARTLEVRDVDFEREEIFVRHGKGYFGERQRVVPVGKTALWYLEEYLSRSRPKLLGDKTSSVLFITRRGRPLRIEAPDTIVKRYAALAGIQRKVRTHTIRHSFATHLLKHGADIRHVQEMLGHSSLESTKVYTRLEISDLKKVHQKTHPRERR